MQLNATETIASPRDQVWAKITDFDRLEDMAKRHAEITRTGNEPTWRAQVEWRGKMRDMTVEVAEMRAPDTLSLIGQGSGISADIAITLTAIDATQTQIEMNIAVRGRSFTGKALVQGLALARGPIEDKFQKRVAGFAKGLATA